jgi:hypothetical protein
VFLFYTVSLLDILHLSFSMELLRMFVVVESSGQVESCLPKKLKCHLSLNVKKIILSLGVVLLSSFLLVSWCLFLFFCISSCLLQYPLLFSYVPFLPMSSRRPPSETMVLFGVRTAVFLLGGEVIAIGVFFLIAGPGMYPTVGGSYVGGWDRLSVLSDGVRVKQV